MYFVHPVYYWAKEKNKSVSCSRSENCNAECVFFFFFTIHEKAMCNAVFIFFNKTSGRKYIKTIALVSFQHLLRTLPVSYQNDLCDHLFYTHSVHL